MMPFEPLDYDNAGIGSEVRWLGKTTVIGFITSVEEYGWVDDDTGKVVRSCYIMVANCDGTTHEFDLGALAIYCPTVMVRVFDDD